MRVILQQHRRLVGACHENVFLVQVARHNLVLAVVPQPCEFAARMLRLIISLEPIVCCLQLCRYDKVVIGRIQGPDVRSEDHDPKADVRITMALLHTLLELVREVLTKTDVCGTTNQPPSYQRGTRPDL